VIQVLVDLNNQVLNNRLLKFKKKILCNGLYNDERISDVLTKGKTNKTNKAANKARTPKSLFGIDLNIA